MKKYIHPIISKLFTLMTEFVFEVGNSEPSKRITMDIPGHLYLKGIEYKGYVHMFFEDFQSSIMPFTRIAGKKNFNITIDPDNDQIKNEIKDVLLLDHRGYELEDAFCDFIRDAVQNILYYGAVSFEVTLDNGSLGFEELNPWSVKKIFGRYYQIIPKSIAKKIKSEPKIISIPNENIFYVGIPKELGSYRSLRTLFKRLLNLSEPIFPKFTMESLEFNEKVEFNVAEYGHLKDSQILRITKKFGWDGRSISDKNLEYYNIQRFLQYNKAKALIRESITDELNRIFKNVYGVTMLVSGLPTSTEIDKLVDSLKKGDVVFKDIVDKVLIN